MSCGTGSRTKARLIIEQAVNGGKACEGNSVETGVCKLKDCPLRLELQPQGRMLWFLRPQTSIIYLM